jgi:hypothetical protein
MSRNKKSLAAAAAVGLAGMLGGGILATTTFASAADNPTPGTSGTSTSAAHQTNADQSQPQRSDEKLLTGTTKTKVTDVVKAKYPNATFVRVETDSDGVYEAHIVNSGSPLIVQVGKDFTITGTQTGGPSGPGGGHTPPSRG